MTLGDRNVVAADAIPVTELIHTDELRHCGMQGSGVPIGARVRRVCDRGGVSSHIVVSSNYHIQHTQGKRFWFRARR